ncbi:MAG TPA: hypothetical protein VHN10_11735, partial [Candidatus Acidoferrales bacterium]|nr:hypothetical protein [Candidatus Acidoferrales bacterium]
MKFANRVMPSLVLCFLTALLFLQTGCAGIGGSPGGGKNPGATVPAVPTGLAAAPGNAQVMLSWAASSGATGYS